MVNISLTLYTKGFFGSFVKSPTQMGSLSINNSVTNISRLGTFKRTEAFHLELKVVVADSFRNSVNAVQDEREVLLSVHAPFIYQVSSEINTLGIKLSMVEQCANVAIIYNFG
jgi:hypothetical protein